MKLLLKKLMVFSGMAVCCFAQAQTKPMPLHLVYPQESSLKNPVTVQFNLMKSTLHVTFEVHTPELYAKKHLQAGEYPYQFDVVEIFVAVNKKNPTPYYEFELSPYNQVLQVKILVPLKNVVEGIDMGIHHSVQPIPGGWRGKIAIPLKNLGWQGDPCELTGNAYAILGNPPRSYWSLNLPAEAKPNFHKPEYFKPLLCGVNKPVNM